MDREGLIGSTTKVKTHKYEESGGFNQNTQPQGQNLKIQEIEGASSLPQPHNRSRGFGELIYDEFEEEIHIWFDPINDLSVEVTLEVIQGLQGIIPHWFISKFECMMRV